MYAPFFGLQHAPFSIAPDPRYLFMSDRHREALAHLLYGLDAGGGFVLLTGEVGTGKTTVCRCFLEQIPAHCNVAYIFNPKLTVGELLRSICDEFGVTHQPAVPGAETVKDCLDPLNAFLLQAHAAGRNNVLIIDEAQNLAPDVLEQLRLLTNLETSERKLLQIILIGQPELRDMVTSPSLEQLAQRVIARFHLDALSPQETQQYIAHRMAVAGLAGPQPFDRRAVQRVHALTQGVPRRINLLCDRALLGAYAAGERAVGADVVRQAAREVLGPRGSRSVGTRKGAWRQRWAAVAGGMLLGAAAVACAGWIWGLWRGTDAVQAIMATAARPPSGAASTPAAAALTPFVPGDAAAPLLLQFLRTLPAGENAAWQSLAQAWGATTVPQAGDDVCTVLAQEALACYRNRRAGLSLVRQLDRPVVLTLYPGGSQGPSVAVVLRRLEGGRATLEGAGHTVQVALADLAPVWRGEVATLWRTPPGMPDSGDLTAVPAGAAWLDQQLALALAGPGRAVGDAVAAPAQRRARIHQFQLTQGLTPDGLAGPLTLMLLNRAAGVQEPRLRNGA